MTTLVPEKKICGLTILKILGSGSFGKVYKVKEDKAFKVIKEKDITLTHGTLVETTILSQIRHPHLLYAEQIFYTNVYNNQVGILLPLMPTNLYNYLNTHPNTSWENRRSLFYQICSTVSALHSMKILHLDIKPSNVLLDRNADGSLHPYLSDFGMSEYVNDVNSRVDFETDKITKNYRPYENYASIDLSEVYSGASCIWSLGQLGMFIFTGDPLFPGNKIGAPHEHITSWFSQYLTPERITDSIGVWFKEAKYPIPAEGYKVLVNLLSSMVNLKHRLRPKINEVLGHPFFAGMTPILGSMVAIPPLVERKEVPEIGHLVDLFNTINPEIEIKGGRGMLTHALYMAINLLYRVPVITEPQIYAAVALQTGLVFYDYIKGSNSHNLTDFKIEDVKNTQIDLLMYSRGQAYHPSVVDYLTDVKNQQLVIELALHQPKTYIDLINIRWPVIPNLQEMVKV